jgi:glutamyl-tRNA reductase
MEQGKERLIEFLVEKKKIAPGILKEHLYFHTSSDAVDHVFRVAAGLDSMVLGELEVTGQLKEAYGSAMDAGTCKTYLNTLIQQSLKIVKILRNQTGISDGFISVGTAAVELAGKVMGDFSKKRGLIIGAGEISELAAVHLNNRGIGSLSVINRTYSKAEKLALSLGGRAFPFDKLTDVLTESDIIISSTGASEQIITQQVIREAMIQRRQEPMFFIDIAVPRDIDPEISDLPGVYLYDIDDLENAVQSNLEYRKSEAEKAFKIIAERVAQYESLMKLKDISPVIISIKEKAESIRKSETGKFLKKHNINDPKMAEQIDILTSSIVKKLLHEPIVSFKRNSIDTSKGGNYLKFVKEFFNLE